MKINEVTHKQLNEGPLDFARQVGAGIKGLAQGGLQGAGAGWRQQGAANAQQDMINTVAKQAEVKWAEYNQNIKAGTGSDATPDQAVAWLTQFQGGIKPTTAPENSTPAAITQWLRKEVGMYMAKSSGLPTQSLPDISKLRREELLALKKQLQAA